MSDTLRLELALAELRSARDRKYSPDQPRDDQGRFGDGGGGESGVPSDMTLMESVRLAQFVGSGSDLLNAGLQAGVPLPEAKELQGLLERSTLDSPMTLYRGGSAAEFASLKVGDTIKDPAFVSTSTDQAVAEENARIAGVRSLDNSPGWTMEVAAPAGTHALDVNKTLGADSPLPKENEVLIGAGTTFHIDAVDPEVHSVHATVVPGAKSLKFDDSQPRDNTGRWTSDGGGGAAGPDLNAVHAALYGEHAGTPTDPVPCAGDIERAAKIIAEGGNVTLAQPQEIATLLDKMQSMVQEAQAAGKDAPVFDLCNASVEGTNLFCQDHVTDDQGNPLERVQMPQLATKDPVPGSPADGLPRNQFGEVDMSQQFAEFLAQTGRPPEETTIDAKLLRASQDELNGVKVAGIADAITNGSFDPTTGRIWVTSDNYVIDGHHRWAATVADEYATGSTINIPVRRLDMDIGTALTTATYWTQQMGIGGASLTAKAYRLMVEAAALGLKISKTSIPLLNRKDTLAFETKTVAFGLCAEPMTVDEARLMLGLAELGVKFDPGQERDDFGRWTSGGALTVRSLANPTKTFPEPRELPVFGLTQAAQDAVYTKLEKAGITHAALCNEIATRIGDPRAPIMDEALAWYPEAKDTAAAMAADSNGKVSAEQAEAVIASLSPQMDWENNVSAARDVVDFVASGGADGKTTDEAALAFIEDVNHPNYFQTADNFEKAISIATGGSIDDNLTGMKVRSFFNNIDDPNATRDVTIDTHMLKAFSAVDPQMPKSEALGLLNQSSAAAGQQYGGAGYVAISEAVRAVSADWGVPPDAVQAAYWLSVRDTRYEDIQPTP